MGPRANTRLPPPRWVTAVARASPTGLHTGPSLVRWGRARSPEEKPKLHSTVRLGNHLKLTEHPRLWYKDPPSSSSRSNDIVESRGSSPESHAARVPCPQCASARSSSSDRTWAVVKVTGRRFGFVGCFTEVMLHSSHGRPSSAQMLQA